MSTARMHDCGDSEHAPPVIYVSVFNKLDELVCCLDVAGRRQSHGHDNHARQGQHVHFETSANIVHFAVNPHMKHRIESVNDIIYKHVVAPGAAVPMDAASEKGTENG